jgi:6-pyruvoyltetrahydropterin/6-carboxytetrahydropterin synthase
MASYRVSRQIDFCYGHRLLNYDGKCKYLHGHNGRAVIVIESPSLDARGMVLDFSDIKRVVSRWIDDHLDHRMILHRDDPVVPYLKQLGEPTYLIDVNPTAENIARLIYEFAAGQSYPVTRVDLWETRRCYASYGQLGSGESRTGYTPSTKKSGGPIEPTPDSIPPGIS